MKALDLTGFRYGRLLVISKSSEKLNDLIAWDCLCDCGRKKTATVKNLRNGSTKSCGCLHIERAMKHVRSNERPIGFERVKKQNGRVEIKTADGFKLKHRFLIEQAIGRELKEGEVVHHIDHDKTNNDITNLVLMTSSEHTTYHNLERGKKHG